MTHKNTNIYLKNPISLKGKKQHFTLSLPWLSLQRWQLFALFSLAISPLRRQPFALSSFAIFSKAATLYSLLLDYSQLKIPFFSLDFTLYFSSPHREDPWVKAIKFFVA